MIMFESHTVGTKPLDILQAQMSVGDGFLALYSDSMWPYQSQGETVGNHEDAYFHFGVNLWDPWPILGLIDAKQA